MRAMRPELADTVVEAESPPSVVRFSRDEVRAPRAHRRTPSAIPRLGGVAVSLSAEIEERTGF